MQLDYSSRYKKQYKKLSPSIKKKLKKRISLLIEDEFNVILNNHSLTGKYNKYRSINITGDLRVVYMRESNDFYFYAVGTYSELYE